MGLIEISGPIYSGMWHYGPPYLELPVGPVDISPIEMPEQLRSSLFMEYLTMCSQTGTYLETAAHAVAGRDTIEKVALERAWMVPTTVIHTPKGEREKVTLDDVKRALDRDGLTIEKGDAVLLHTGWDREWRNPERFLDWCPYVSQEAWFWIMDQGPSIMGADGTELNSSSQELFSSELWPRSKNPKWSEPISLGGGPGVQVRIAGVVVGSYKPR